MERTEKGNVFTGKMAGGHYRRWSRFLGMGNGFYERVAGEFTPGPGMRVLDLGCGPGSLCEILARRAAPDAEIIGLDLSADQLAEARRHTAGSACRTTFLQASMDEVPLPDAGMDLVFSSMAFHETPSTVRKRTVAEVARLLRPGGSFILADLGELRFGLWSMIWMPVFLLHRCRHHGDGQDSVREDYEALCKKQGLLLRDDRRINSMVQRWVFRKAV
ncbi:MAG: class I SAM-dependent methyltransferase [Desulfovibrio sp.]